MLKANETPTKRCSRRLSGSLPTNESTPQVKKQVGRPSKKNKNTGGRPRKITEAELPTTAIAVNGEIDVFGAAKRAFHRSGTFKIVGRIEEKAEFTSFWYETVCAERGASIYISGNPGTGKTALVDEMLTELQAEESVQVLKINCMMLKDPLRVFYEFASQLQVEHLTPQSHPTIILDALTDLFTSPNRRFCVLVVDEVDQIGMKDPELLCKLLAMPYLTDARVCVIGIANSMDLTERFLPRLKVLNCTPRVLHFPQYTVPDISSILCDRLESINAAIPSDSRCFIDRPAIELTARKVASTGDLRRALDILRQAIDLAEEEHKLAKTSTQPSSSSLVKIGHVVRIMDKFGNSQSTPLILLKSLNLHQKVLLAAIIGSIQIISTTNTSSKSILTVQKLYDDYCRGSTLPPKLYDSVTRSEFIDLISNLESMNIIGKSSNTPDQWQIKIFLQIPIELVKTMISQELPTIKVLFGL